MMIMMKEEKSARLKRWWRWRLSFWLRKLGVFEFFVLPKINCFIFKKNLVNDWQKVMLISTGIFICLSLFISFLRSTFYDVIFFPLLWIFEKNKVMLIGVILIKGRTEFEKLNFVFMRFILILMSFSLVMDLIWLIFYTDVISFIFFTKLIWYEWKELGR